MERMMKALKSISWMECRKTLPFLEMMDQLNEQLLEEGNEPVLFDHDCREGFAELVL